LMKERMGRGQKQGRGVVFDEGEDKNKKEV
jgi:hypothetical protein